tara:strand:- start:308 stop:463 length:156 start_codon:yes stop_codon:yes gene_type:complete
MSKLFDTWFHDMIESGDTRSKQIEYLKTKGLDVEWNEVDDDFIFELFMENI